MKRPALFISLILLASALSAQQLAVPGEYSTIQAAIDAATEGDTVLVDEGTYLENINFLGKAITVGSMFLLDGNEDHIANTIIDGSEPDDPKKGTVVTMNTGEDTTTVLCGFTITGGTGSDVGVMWGHRFIAGGGVLMDNAGGKILSNHIIDNHMILNDADMGHLIMGAGVASLRSGLKESIIRNNIIERDSITTTEHGYGAGIFIGWGSEGRIENNVIAYNKSTSVKNAWGGGIHVNQYAHTQDYPIYISNNRIYENSVYSGSNCKGGGIFLSDCPDTTIILSNNIIHDNYACHVAGGVYILYDTKCLMYNNTLHNNSTDGWGNNLCVDHDCIVKMYNNLLSSEIENDAPDFHIFEDTRNTVHSIGNLLAEEPSPDPQLYVFENIVADPGYADDQFNLSESSLAVGRGMDSVTVDGIAYYGSRFDHYGVDRKLASADQRPDIGAVESGYERSECDYNTATVIRVPDEQETIQDAIDAAADGDTVLVLEGRYFENIDFKGKPITVTSAFILEGEEFYKARTLIDGSQSTNPDTASAVTMWSGEDTTSVLNGLTITGGAGTVNSVGYYLGGGVYIQNSGGKIVNNIIAGNHLNAESATVFGAGISASVPTDNYLVIRDNMINNNTSTGKFCYGGGIYITGDGILIEGNSVLNHSVNYTTHCNGGGVCLFLDNQDSQGVIIRNNTISANTAVGNNWNGFGGGLSLANDTEYEYDLSVYNNVISDNSIGAFGGGVCFYFTKRAEFYNNTLLDNKALFDGNSFAYTPGVDVKMYNNIIWSDIDNNKKGSYLFRFGEDNECNFSLSMHNNILQEVMSNDCIDQQDNTYMSPKLDEYYMPKSTSPAIGRGVESVEIDGVLYHAPAFDMAGNPRPNGVDEHVDIGAFETSDPLALYGNAFLKILRFGDYKLVPEFNKYTTDYAVSDEACDSDLNLAEAFAEDALATVTTVHADACSGFTVVTVTSSDGNKEKVYTIGFDGIGDVLVDELTLFPNPFSSFTTLELPMEECVDKIELLDMTGKVVRSLENISDSSVKISRGDLPSGLYLLYVQGEKKYLNKVIIE